MRTLAITFLLGMVLTAAAVTAQKHVAAVQGSPGGHITLEVFETKTACVFAVRTGNALAVTSHPRASDVSCK